jgi:DNA-binding response OmpR family regulator
MGSAVKRVLVADDENDLREFVALVLRDEGYEVDSVSDGQAALERIALLCPDLLVLDLMMPKLDGWGVLRGLRKLEHAPRVVVLSGFLDAERAAREGACACLSKPFRSAELLEICRCTLAGERQAGLPESTRPAASQRG